MVTDNRFVYWTERFGPTMREALPALGIDADGNGIDQTADCDDNNPGITTGNTCVSESDVTIEDASGDVTVSFPKVTRGGSTSITASSCTPPAVSGITLVPTPPLCAEINTSASFEDSAKVCISYNDTGLSPVEEANLQMVRCQSSTSCELLACNPPQPVDTVNNRVCGCTSGFSRFAVGIPLDSDTDFIPDLLDNCPTTSNPFQEDSDRDGIGDACDSTAIQLFVPLVWR